MNTSLGISNKNSNKKQKEMFAITDITTQDNRKFLKNFKNLPYLDYKSKQVHNEPTEAYLFLIKHITKLMKSDRRVWLLANFFNSSVNGKIL